MARLWTDAVGGASAYEWRRAPTVDRHPGPDELAAFRERLLASLRAAHGLGVTFGLSLSSGPVPRLTLGCSDPASARWVSRILIPAYGRASWIRVPNVAQCPTSDRQWGRRVRAWPEVLREPTDGPSAFDALALAMRGLAPGVSVFGRFSPCPATWSRPREPDPPRGSRTSIDANGIENSRQNGRRARPPSPVGLVPSFPLFWKTSLSAVFPPEDSDDGTPRERARSAIEAALRSRRANGIRFSRNLLHLPWGPPSIFLSEEELVSFLPGLEPGTARPEGPEDGGLPVLPLGRSATGGVVGPPVEPGQGRHIAILGETGMGKSSTLVAVARRASTLGGVVLLDPLGETARSFLLGLSEREHSRLVLVAPHSGSSGINALEGIGGQETDPILSDRRLNDLVHALRRVRSGRYVDSYWGPRLEEMLTRAVRAAAAFPEGTLADAHTLLATGGRTRQVVPPEAQERVRELSERIRERREDAEGARRLLYEVVRSPVLVRMLCERNPILHAKELVEPDRIAVVSGEASAVGESVARYLLAVYLALVWSELLARPTPSKTFVILDESQWFSHESLAEMLRLARRGNVHIVLATQTVGSLAESVADAVWTNVSDFVAFRGSPEEARELSRATRGLTVEEILSLPRGHAAVLLGKGSSLEWVRTVGRPPDSGPQPMADEEMPADEGQEAGVREPRKSTSGVTAEQVLGWLREKASALTSGNPLRVDLHDLRGSLDPEGRALREVGSRLGRVGALLASTRTANGSVWLLDPAKIPPAGEATPVSPSAEASQAPQPS